MTFYQFQEPAFLLLLLLLPVLAWWLGRMGPEAALRFSNTRLLQSISRARRSRAGRFLFALRFLALASLIAAFARPQLGRTNETLDADGIDIVLTLDLSGSMRALDLATRENVVTRFDAVQDIVLDFIDRRDFDRIALVGFAAEAHVISPLTLNHDWLKQNLERLDLGVIDPSGTAIGDALAASLNRWSEDDEDRGRVVIFLSDGDNNAGKLSPGAAAETARAMGVTVHTIAAGSQGRVPVAEMNEDGRILRDTDGKPIYRGRTADAGFDKSQLENIAETSGGEFFRATEPGDLERIYDEIDELEKTEVELRTHATFTELFVWPAALGLFLLLLEQVLASTRYRRLP